MENDGEFSKCPSLQSSSPLDPTIIMNNSNNNNNPSQSQHVQFNELESIETPQQQRVLPSGGNIQRGLGSARKKRVKQSESEELIRFDDSKDLYSPLPVNLKLYCLHCITAKYHHCKILERKEFSSNKPLIYRNNIIADEKQDSNRDFTNHNYMYYIHYSEWYAQCPIDAFTYFSCTLI
jgi:hypothetical protein